MTTLSDGAEASVRRDDGTVVKDRHAKDYRHPRLDQRLRTERTAQEARLLEKARQAGVPVPDIVNVDDTTLILSYIDGTPLKSVLADHLDRCDTVGAYIARLHDRHIVHGDLTTSNLLLLADDVYIIDFGLGFFSERVEDYAVDLHLLRQVLDASHTAVADQAMQRILDGYRAERADASAVIDQYHDVRQRGRYK